MRLAAGGNHADGMIHLMHDGDVSGSLEDLKAVVVSGGEHRHVLLREHDAARRERAVLRTVKLVAAILGGGSGGSLARFRKQRRNGPFRTNDDRRAFAPRHIRLASIEPELG